MRLLIDSLIALMLVAILAGVIFHHRQQQQMVREYQTAHRELAHLRETMMYYKALENDTINEYGYPPYIAPSWFPEGLPTNRLIPGRHPWVDIAPPGDMNDQPPDPIIHSQKQAGYWYNPNRGIIRARVAEQFTEQATLALYNQINTTMLVSLPRVTDSTRLTLPHPLLVSSDESQDQNPKRPTLLGVQPRSAKAASPQTAPVASYDKPAPPAPLIIKTLLEADTASASAQTSTQATATLNRPAQDRSTPGRPSLLDPALSTGQ